MMDNNITEEDIETERIAGYFGKWYNLKNEFPEMPVGVYMEVQSLIESILNDWSDYVEDKKKLSKEEEK